MRAVCPQNLEHKEFITVAHVSQDWRVDEKGQFIEEIRTLETVADPNPDNSWHCAICDSPAIVLHQDQDLTLEQWEKLSKLPAYRTRGGAE